MCETCENDAVEWHNAIPGFTLMFAQKSGSKMIEGQWALGQGGEPLVIWDKRPEIDPDFCLPPDEEDENKFVPFHSPENKLFMIAYQNMREMIKCDPETGFELVQSAMLVGFDSTRETNGCFAAWLCHKLGEHLKSHPVPDENAATDNSFV